MPCSGPPWKSERDMKGQEGDAVTTSGTDIVCGTRGKGQVSSGSEKLKLLR